MKILFLLMLLGVSSSANPAEKIVTAARKQVGVTVSYDPAYVRLSYPGGDVPRDRGVCTDVLVRALRDGVGVDLQELVHEDMRANFGKYPKRWGLSRADKNIDHRRVPNLQTYLQRRGFALPVAKAGNVSVYQAGDIVTCTVPPNLPHVMIVSDRKTKDGRRPLMIHNIGSGAEEEDVLSCFPITGHYRWR